MISFKEIEPYKAPSKIRISTISALAHLKVTINLKKLFETVNLVSELEVGILGLKYYDKNLETKTTQRHHRHSIIQHDITEVKAHFQNQLTLLWGFISSDGTFKKGNGFIFNNGKIKTVGLKCDEDIEKSYKALLVCLKKQCLGKNVFTDEMGDEVHDIRLHEMRPTMYNTDFAIHFNLKRDILFNLIVNKYNLQNSEYEPDIYPAVKIKFSWNSDFLKGESSFGKTPGVCYCTQKCKGKGLGCDNGGCKIVTVCAFQSGKIIITGGNSLEQVMWMYNYINTLMKDNFNELYFQEPIMTIQPEKKKKMPKTKKKGIKTSENLDFSLEAVTL